MHTVRIIAEIGIQKQYRAELLPVLKALVAGSCAEKGNKVYDLTEDTAKEGHFFVIEEWLSEEALSLHNETPHFKAFVAAIEGKTECLHITKVASVFAH